MAKETAPITTSAPINVAKGTFLGYQEYTKDNKPILFEVYVTDAGVVVNSLASGETLNEGDKRTLVRTLRDGKSYWNALLVSKPKHAPAGNNPLDHV
jgi:hypothetical protein